MIVLGFSGIPNGSFYRERYGLRFVGHDSAAALLVDGRLAFAVEEERLSREKHTSLVPIRAVRAALEHAGITPRDLDVVAYPWNATGRRLIHMWLHHPRRIPVRHWASLALAGHRVVRDLMTPRRAIRELGRQLGAVELSGVGVPHHLGHAACAYFTSPFESAAVLTVDGQGEDESACLGEFLGSRWRRFQSIHSPDSIGILYGMVTDFLGMRAGWDEYKVMAMAATGDPSRFRTAFDRLVVLGPGGQYTTSKTALVFRPGACEPELSRAFGMPARRDGEELAPIHFDLAAALQEKTESVLFHLARRLRSLSKEEDLCLAGGVFQNSVANGKLLRSGLFRRIHVPSVPGDHGGALGAALLVHHRSANGTRHDAGFTPFCGPGYADDRIESAIASCGDKIEACRAESITERTADLLADGRVVGWFQGRLEYGPRALGGRSILASPVAGDMRDRVNRTIKHRELFRPFAASIPEEDAGRYFELDGPSPYMQFVVPVRPEASMRIPAVVHAGTCRAHTVSRRTAPLFHELLRAFERRAGVPVLLNTSFNVGEEPIVCSPENALSTFLRSELDALAIGGFLVVRRGRWLLAEGSVSSHACPSGR